MGATAAYSWANAAPARARQGKSRGAGTRAKTRLRPRHRLGRQAWGSTGTQRSASQAQGYTARELPVWSAVVRGATAISASKRNSERGWLWRFARATIDLQRGLAPGDEQFRRNAFGFFRCAPCPPSCPLPTTGEVRCLRQSQRRQPAPGQRSPVRSTHAPSLLLLLSLSPLLSSRPAPPLLLRLHARSTSATASLFQLCSSCLSLARSTLSRSFCP